MISYLIKTIRNFVIVILLCNSGQIIKANIIKVPSDFNTIAQAVINAQAGDTIILSPGTYNEKNIDINIPLTISSEWLITGDQAFIDVTYITPTDAILFSIKSDNVEISGLTIFDGDHTLDINSRVTVKYNRFYNNLDPVSMETGGGGYVGYNLMENNKDDGIDLDISISSNYTGSDILIEHNTITNSHDDGIEIRLFAIPNQNIHYEIRNNLITGSNNAGIQLISYDIYTGKVFDIHHNIIRNCKIALGCMGGSNTSENLGGASLMDEKVFLYNNTFIENQMGATGGNSMIAINNIISGNTIGGFKRFGPYSVIANNLFYNNMGSDFIEINYLVELSDNIHGEDPLLDEITFIPANGSPAIDAGLNKFILDEITVIEIAPEEYSGIAPDIGAMETNFETAVAPVTDISDDWLIRNTPNPFLQSTKISFNLAQKSFIKLDVYDMMGRNISILAEGLLNKGMYTFEWLATDENGNKLPPGIYFARIHMGNSISNTRMLLLQ
jgi:hypothetical protein